MNTSHESGKRLSTSSSLPSRTFLSVLSAFMLGVASILCYQIVATLIGYFISKNPSQQQEIPQRIFYFNQLPAVTLPLVIYFENKTPLILKLMIPLLVQGVVSLVFFVFNYYPECLVLLYVLDACLGLCQVLLQNGAFGFFATLSPVHMTVVFIGQTFAGVFSATVFFLGWALGGNETVQNTIFFLSWAVMVLACGAVTILFMRSVFGKRCLDAYKATQRKNLAATNCDSSRNKSKDTGDGGVKDGGTDESERVGRMQVQRSTLGDIWDVIKKIRYHLACIYLLMVSIFMLWPMNITALAFHKFAVNWASDDDKRFHMKNFVFVMLGYNWADFAVRVFSVKDWAFMKTVLAAWTIKYWLVLRYAFLVLFPAFALIKDKTLRITVLNVTNVCFAITNGAMINFVMRWGNCSTKLEDRQRKYSGHLMVGFLVLGIISGVFLSEYVFMGWKRMVLS